MKEEMQVAEIYISVEIENIPAAEMYKKIGFTFVKSVEYEFDGVTYRENQMKIRL